MSRGRKHVKNERAALARLPGVDEVWEAAFIDFETPPRGAPEDAPTLAALVVDVATGQAVGMSLEAKADADALVAAVTDAMQAPLVGRARRPAVVRVRDTKAGSRLEKTLPSGTEVEYADRLPAFDAVAADLIRAAHETGEDAPGMEGAGDWLTEDFFDAVATFYEATPWLILEEAMALQLQIGDEPPFVAAVFGADPAHETGFTVFRSVVQFEEMMVGRRKGADVLLVSFMDGSEVFQPLAQMLRDEGWRLAGPAAYPAPAKLAADGVDVDLTDEDVRLLSTALRATAVIVAMLREGRDPLESPIHVRNVEGGVVDVSLLAVGSPDDDEDTDTAPRGAGTNLELFPADDGAGAPETADESARVLLEAIEHIQRLPAAQRSAPRLRWTFFLGPEPYYVGEDEDEIEDAYARFTEWAYFIARPAGGKTLLERMLNDARREIPAERIRAMRHVATPRHSLYHVARSTARDMTVRDVVRRETVHVVLDPGATAFERNDKFLGSLLPRLGSDWRLGGSVVPVRGDGDPDQGPVDPEIAPLLVEHILGASNDWIDDIDTIAELSEVWTGFRDDFELAGLHLPTFAELQRRIRKAAAFEDVWSVLARRTWWYEEERNLCGRMAQRAWNLTPRDVLGGMSPLAAAEAHAGQSGGHRKGKGRRRQ